MYTLEKITEFLERPRDSDDDFNETKALILTELSGSLDEFNSVSATLGNLQKENENLKKNNALLYARVESQIMKPEKEEPEPEEMTLEDIVKANRKLYEGVF